MCLTWLPLIFWSNEHYRNFNHRGITPVAWYDPEKRTYYPVAYFLKNS